MPTERTMTVTSLVVLTPTKHTDTHNIVRIHRANELDKENVLHVAGGSHTGIIVNKLQELPIDADAGVVLSFQVWLSDSRTNSRRQETRVIRYRLSKNVPEADGKNAANNFFSKILNPFPKTYVAFMKRALGLLQGGFEELDGVELDMRVAADEEQMAMPDAHQYGSDSEVEEVTAAHVQEVLEHAYPNGLPVFTIAELLRSTEEEITAFLYELEGQGIITKAGDNEWIRVDTRHVEESLASVKGNITHGGTVRAAKGEEPTVAIICCLFSEKQCIDAIIEDAQTIHRYKSGGDSNVYTVGKIGKHRVVATKLAIIGDSREAKTSAGSITTRLLGNYQKIEHVLIVGIGGAVPHVTEAALHGRLGDVVVADSYFYAHDILTDRKTERFAGFDFKKYVPNDPTLLSLARASPKELAREWNDATRTVVQTLGGEFARPNSATDVLAVPVGGGNVVVVAHANEGRTEESVAHIAPVGALCSIKKTEEQDSETTAHFFREQFAREHALRAYDGGVDQVIASIQGNRIDSWTLLRGCADYQNGQSRSAKIWQGYAAARAAGLAQALVKRLPA